MKQRPDTVDEILQLRTEDRRRYRWRKTIKGAVLQETDAAPEPRGENRKNMVRKLRRGQQRLTQARASGAIPKELPPDHPVRKRVERDWQRLTNPPLEEHVSTDEQGRTMTTYSSASAGHLGRRAAHKKATTTKRRSTRQAEAKALRDRGLTERAIVEHMKKTGHIKATTKIDSAIRNVRRWLNPKR